MALIESSILVGAERKTPDGRFPFVCTLVDKTELILDLVTA